MQQQFKYSLIFDGEPRIAEPLGVDKAQLKYEKQAEFIFFRKTISESLIFRGDDYKVLAAYEKSGQRCQEVKLKIDALCGGTYKPFFAGYFSLNDVKWNEDKGTATVAPKTDDIYRPILENYNRQHNILNINTVHSIGVKLDLDASFEFTPTTHGTQPAADPDTWALFLTANYWIDGTTFQKGRRFDRDIHFRLVRTEPLVNGQARDLSGQGWRVVDQDLAAGTARYAKTPDLFNFQPYNYGSFSDITKYANLIQIPCGAIYDQAKYIDVTAAFTANGCWSVPKSITTDRQVKILWEFGAFGFTRNRKFLDVVRYLLIATTSDPVYLPETNEDLSAFFTSPINYVTGEPNKLINLYLAQKTDILSYSSSEAASTGMISLKELLEALQNMFNVQWFINQDGKFQLEHASYFDQSGAVDLTTAFYKKWIAGSNAYEYEKTKMPRFERLIFSESENIDFRSSEIEYGGVCVNHEDGQDAADVTIARFNNDIAQLLTSANTGDKNGFVLIVSSNGEVDAEIGDLSGRLAINGHLSAANLMKRYHLHGRVLGSGLLNGKSVVFKSIKRTKKQVPLSVPGCCTELDPYARYITQVSNKGALQSMEISLKDGMATLDIVHETTGSGTVGLDRQFSNSFDLSFK